MTAEPRIWRCASSAPLLFLLIASLTACESEALDLVREIEAARGDCTVDGLRETSEECVQMFERYAEMGTEAINTYIGALRAMDEALRRNPELRIDTTDLPGLLRDRARVADPLYDPVQGIAGGPVRGDIRGRQRVDEYGAPVPVYPPDFDPRYRPDYDPGYGPVGPQLGPSYGADDALRYAAPSTGRFPGEPDGTSRYSEPGQRPTRGVLLPPETRLRRPWLDADLAEPPLNEYARTSPGQAGVNDWPSNGWAPYGSGPGGWAPYGPAQGGWAPYGSPRGGWAPYGSGPGDWPTITDYSGGGYSRGQYPGYPGDPTWRGYEP